MTESQYIVDPAEARSEMPVALGRILKVPASGWKNWGIEYKSEEEFRKLLEEDAQGYKDEWELTSDQGQVDIAEAAKSAGLGNVNSNLNDANSGVVSEIVKESEDEVYILDFGAGSGNTTLAIYQELDEEGRDKVTFHLLDPSEGSLEDAEQKLDEKGLSSGDYEMIVGTAMEEMPDMDSEFYDVVTANAAAHHHGYMGGEEREGEEIENYGVKGPLNEVHRVLVPNGFYVDSDWRNSMWEHPWRVREFLKELGMEEEFIDQKLNFPEQAKERAPEKDPMLQKANREIKDFWKEYDKVRSTDEPQFLLLEGHRKTKEIKKQFENVGLKTDTEDIRKVLSQNPFYLNPDSGLNSLVVGQKPDPHDYTAEGWAERKKERES